jgi:pSer/pThr/pTyr-binding forkhead associated (FHA) protein
MPLLVVEKGHDKGKAIPVAIGGTVIIGRDSSTALPLRDTMTSRMHCKIQAQEDGFYLTDLESMNGTYLNGEAIPATDDLAGIAEADCAARLTSGDFFSLGPSAVNLFLFFQK